MGANNVLGETFWAKRFFLEPYFEFGGGGLLGWMGLGWPGLGGLGWAGGWTGLGWVGLVLACSLLEIVKGLGANNVLGESFG